MGRVLTNTIALGQAIESSLGVVPTSGWKTLEPNGISGFGATITTTPRNPISNKRQRRKGTVTDLDSAVEFEADMTHDALDDIAEGFFFSGFANGDLTFRGASVGGTGFTVPALSASQAGRLIFDAAGPFSLIFSKGYVNAANNGLKVLTADPVTSGTTLQFAGAVVETAPANASVEIAGIRPSLGDLAITVSAGVATLTAGNNGVAGADRIDFTTLGLKVGQYIHVGGLTGANRFSAGFGYGRIRTIATLSVTLDKLLGTLATDTGAAETVDILFGKFLRNVAVGNAEYIERSFTFEVWFPGLQVPGPGDEFQYAKGNFCNQLQLNLPLTDKASFTAGFIGTDTDNLTTTRATGAATARQPLKTTAFNTSADFLRLRVALVDETGITTDFKSATITINNNVSPEKALGFLGAKFVNFGNFDIDVEAQIIFTDSRVISAIRGNTTISMDIALKNDEGALFFDVPSATMSGGDREFPVNESVLANLTIQAFEDPSLGTSLSLSTFPTIP